jgi:hypothetical protein
MNEAVGYHLFWRLACFLIGTSFWL